MDVFVTWFSPQPHADDLPRRFPSPFDDTAPAPITQRAAEALKAQLGSGQIAPGISTDVLNRPEGGKMFGVLVVEAPDGRTGWLKAFSGQLAGGWEVPGWAPAMFDVTARNELEQQADRTVKTLTAAMEALATSAELGQAREAAVTIEERVTRERNELKAIHLMRRQRRHETRASLARTDDTLWRQLDAESRSDDRERRGLESRIVHELRDVTRPLRRLERRLRAMERLRRVCSQRAMRRIHDTYRLINARGQSMMLRQLFPRGEPPWGAADCAAPKLLAFAIRHGLRPVALAEFWWGPPPPGGGRVQGTFFPACQPKCGPVLPFLLDGVDVAPRRTWRPQPHPDDALPIVHEDDRIVVVIKPAGMLSVPARDLAVTDSVWARLRRRHPEALGPLLVHRLDLDTSGLLIATLDLDAYRFLQAQFAARTVWKQYVAWVDGSLPHDRGTITLPLRLDLDQRPRQMVDFIHGREAITEWAALERSRKGTRVALLPRTGRTHQLRVHAAHRDGLAAPIVGDRLYGTAGDRLLLHAASVSFTHPDGRRVSFTSDAPF